MMSWRTSSSEENRGNPNVDKNSVGAGDTAGVGEARADTGTVICNQSGWLDFQEQILHLDMIPDQNVYQESLKMML